MLVKIEGEKYNWIDKNDLYVGYDTATDCCETAEWYVHTKPITSTAYEELPKVDYDLDGYIFDTVSALIGLDYQIEDTGLDEGDNVVFKLIHPSKPPLYLHLYNSHNGYYAHEVLTNLPYVKSSIYL